MNLLNKLCRFSVSFMELAIGIMCGYGYGISNKIPYMHELLSYVIFTDATNPAFSQFFIDHLHAHQNYHEFHAHSLLHMVALLQVMYNSKVNN